MISNISMPQEVEAALDKRTEMGALGDMNRFTQFQMASAIPDAAKQPGGMAGMGMGLGVGMSMGGQMVNQMGQATLAGQHTAASRGSRPDPQRHPPKAT